MIPERIIFVSRGIAVRVCVCVCVYIDVLEEDFSDMVINLWNLLYIYIYPHFPRVSVYITNPLSFIAFCFPNLSWHIANFLVFTRLSLGVSSHVSQFTRSLSPFRLLYRLLCRLRPTLPAMRSSVASHEM